MKRSGSRSSLISILALAILMSAGTLAALGAGAQSESVRPALGPITVRPSVVHVGGTLTISGRTQGSVQFLPPFVIVQSVASRMVDAGQGPCGGKHLSPVASFAVPGGGSGGRGTRQNPPIGTRWTVHIKIPATMDGPIVAGKSARVRTPSGTYRVGVVGVGLDYCVLPKHSNGAFSIGTFQIR